MDLGTVTIIVPQYITEEILSRLPANSLLRFKCVSKSFNSLITSPLFARMHLGHALISEPSILASTVSGFKLIEHRTSFRVKAHLDFPPKSEDQNHGVRILGSCNGLVAVAILVNNEKKDLYLWNPLTRDHKKLPGCPTLGGQSVAYAFGFDSSTNDYKLFISTQYYRKLGVAFYSSIYSLRKNSWKTFPPPPIVFFSCLRFGYFLDGALHWLSKTVDTVEILAFDLKTERFDRVPVPVPGNNMDLGLLDGRIPLTICALPDGFLPFQHWHWVMKEFGAYKSWTKLLVTGVDKEDYRYHLPLCTSKGDQVILINRSMELVRSDAKEISKILEKFRFCECSSHSVLLANYQCGAILYAESLLSPNNVNVLN